MRLIELLRHPDLGEDDEATIYVVRPWTPEAAAIIVCPAPASTAPVEHEGQKFDYFLEAFIARDFLEDLTVSDPEAKSELGRCERLIRYADTDA